MEKIYKKLEEMTNIISSNNIIIESLRLTLNEDQQEVFIKEIAKNISNLEKNEKLNIDIINNLNHSIKFK